MYILIIILPLINFFFATLFGRFIGYINVTKIIILCLFLGLNLTILLFFELIYYKIILYIDFFNWLESDSLHVFWSLVFDGLTISMCFIVLFVSLLVHFYSIEYMFFDPFLTKFMSYLSLFTFFMLVLVSSNNLIQTFLGWEGIGLVSYLLINFWYIRLQANKAAIKAMVLNRIGDFGLLAGLLIIFINFKTMDYDLLIILSPVLKSKIIIYNINLINIICFCLFLGAVGKSAQLGLHTWLPDAMEGPTPVSALIHAATLVTAGIFLIIRVSFLFEFSSNLYKLLIIIGAITAILASTIGLMQNDSKKIVAYSTCSQLGYMIFVAGLGYYFISLFHLTNHAFFKALLFLSSGSVIHAINNEQDIRKMGGLKKLLPFTYMTSEIGSLALIGFPFLTGFYSKDFILESSIINYNIFNWFCYFIGSIGALLTAVYSFRSIYLIFLNKPNGYKNIICLALDSKFNIKLVLFFLTIPSVFIGYFSKDLLIGFGSNFFNNAIFINLKFYNIFNVEFLLLNYKLLAVNLSLCGIILVFYFYSQFFKFLYKLKKFKLLNKLYNLFNKKWFFDKLYNEYVGQLFYKFSYSISYKFIDRGLFESIGPKGIGFLFLNIGHIFKKFENLHIYHILLIILMCIIFFFIQIYLYKLFNFYLLILNFIIYLYFINCFELKN